MTAWLACSLKPEAWSRACGLSCENDFESRVERVARERTKAPIESGQDALSAVRQSQQVSVRELSVALQPHLHSFNRRGDLEACGPQLVTGMRQVLG